jgi:hypothetical protein
MSAPAKSWCDPAGESPAQVKGSVLLGSDCCVATGDSGREAYTAIAWGVGLSHERSDIAGAEGFHSLEGNMCGSVMRGAVALPGSNGNLRRHTPEAGAVCGKAARTDLGGGRAMKRASLPLLKRLAFITLLGGAAAPLHKSYIRCSNFVRIAAISSLSLRRHFLSRARTSSVVGSSPDSMR